MRAVIALCVLALIATSHAMPIADEMEMIGKNSSLMEPNAGAGLRVTFLQTGLQKFLDIMLLIINKEFREMTLPNQHMDENVPVIGHITLDITNIKVHNFHIPHGKASSGAPSNFHLNLGPGIGLNIHCDWHWRKVHWPHLSGHGSVDITPQNGDISAAVQITPSAGHFHVTTTGSSCNFDKFNIKFHGGFEAWLLNLFTKILSSKIKKLIDTEVAKQITNILNVKVNELLMKIPTQFAFGGGKGRMNVDASLIQAIGTPTYLDFGFPLAISSVSSGHACPISPPDIQPVDPGATGRMIQIFIGQHFLNCALWTVFTNGILSHVIQSNTRDWALWVPAIYAKWPNMTMEEQLYLYKLGTIALAPGSGVTGDFPCALNLTVVTPQGRAHAATLGVNAHIAFTMWVAPGKTDPHPFFYLKVSSITLSLSVIDTSVGPIDLSLPQGIINFLTPIIVKGVDDLIANGFPIPLAKGFTLGNPSVAFFPSYFAVEADFQYNPSAEQVLADWEALPSP